MRPLHQVVERDKLHWSEKYKSAFTAFKRALTSPPILGYPAEDGIFIFDMDASGQGIGSVLSQVQNGQERVIAYFSRVLTKEERQYCVTRRELLAVVKSVKHFHHYLFGRHFMIRTDHGSLQWLVNFKNPEGQIWHWLQTLYTYDFDIHHCPGTQHKNADDLSRRPCSECRYCEQEECKEQSAEHGCPGHRVCALDKKTPSTDCENWCQPWTKDDLRTWQREDLIIMKVLTWAEAGRKPPWKEVQMESTTIHTFWALYQQLSVIDGILYRKPDPGNKYSEFRL